MNLGSHNKTPHADQTISIGTQNPMTWAELDSTSKFKKHSDYGQLLVTFPTGSGIATVNTYKQQFINHGIIMWTAWFVLGIMMIWTNRWFPYLTNKSNYLHAFFGWSIVILNAYAAISIISINGVKTTGLHNNLGLYCFFGLLAFALTGTATFIIRRKL